VRFDRDRTLSELRAEFGALEAGVETDVVVRVAGRIMLLRRMGKLTFATIKDQDGSVQLFVSRAVLGDEQHGAFDDLDLGDWVGVEGTVMATRKGELSVKIIAFQLLAKALRPLPDKWHGLSDVDTRFRQRYVDLIVNETPAAVRSGRARRAIRRSLASVASKWRHRPEHGSWAPPVRSTRTTTRRPTFSAHRVELHLKRLMVGGFERVFEIGRVFRNEGIDTRHNPEFTMLEAYQAFADYHDMMELTEALVVEAARAALGTTVIEIRGEAVDRPSRGATMVDRPPARGRRSTWGWTSPRRAVLDGSGYQDPGARPAHPRGTTSSSRTSWCGPRSCSTTCARRHHCPGTATTRHWWSDSRWWRVVTSLANAHLSSTTRTTSAPGLRSRPRRRRGDAEAGTIDEDYTARASSTACRPPAARHRHRSPHHALAGVTSIREAILFPTLRPESG
jgi:lysyl-tRNA synthetase class 2